LRARLGEITFLEDECTQLRQGYTAARDGHLKAVRRLGMEIEELEDELAARGECDD
jgi:hypothetical protein